MKNFSLIIVVDVYFFIFCAACNVVILKICSVIYIYASPGQQFIFRLIMVIGSVGVLYYDLVCFTISTVKTAMSVFYAML